jgi:MYXO-CTERM domain-containing protein
MEPDGGAPVDTDCSCEPSGENYCRLIEVECTTDADCAGALTCQDMYGGDAPTIVCVDGEPCPDPAPVDPTSYCAPDGYGYYGGGVGGGGYSEAVANATGNEDANVTQSEREEFFPVDGTNGDGGSKQSPSGCSTASGGAGGSLLLLLAGLLFGRRRRWS